MLFERQFWFLEYWIFICKKLVTHYKAPKPFQRHHILPKFQFPAFRDLRKNSWNRLNLTKEEHKYAHEILSKFLGCEKYSKRARKQYRAEQIKKEAERFYLLISGK